MRSFTLLCTAALSVLYLKKKLYKHNYTGIALNLVGLALISFADIMNSYHATGTQDEVAQEVKEAWWGLGLITIGQIVVSFQVILEEKFMTG